MCRRRVLDLRLDHQFGRLQSVECPDDPAFGHVAEHVPVEVFDVVVTDFPDLVGTGGGPVPTFELCEREQDDPFREPPGAYVGLVAHDSSFAANDQKPTVWTNYSWRGVRENKYKPLPAPTSAMGGADAGERENTERTAVRAAHS